MAKPISDQIAELKARKEKLAARLNTLSAKAKQEDRKLDTRRKIVVGSAILAAIEHELAIKDQMSKLLAKYVEREQDRSAIADLLGASPAPSDGKAP